ncbi:YhdP family protein [Oceanobacter kriegii]|uniref:YhdP family protein n=1 Tax=Oceanobacter kriegii TaxID=64972 RepID=UPI00041D3583|nr:YhdP family protein [Oceanobacter kriegii]
MRFLAAVWTQIWITLVVGLVLLALYTSIGRQLIPLVETWRPDVEQQLSQLLGQPVSIGQLEGDWRYLSPVIRVTDIEVGPLDHPLRLQRLEAELDVSASAFYQLPVFKRIEVDGLQADVRRTDDHQWFSGDWQLLPLPEGNTQDSVPRDSRSSAEARPDSRPLWARLLELQQMVELENWQISVTNPDGKLDHLNINQWLWRHQGNSQSVRGHISWGRQELADISINAALTGQVWPWQSQNGEVVAYVEPQSWTRWIPDDLPMGLQFKELDAGAEVWLTVRDGVLQKVYADLALSHLNLVTNEEPLELDSGRIQIGGELDGNDWHMRVKPQLGDSVPLDDFTISLIQLDESSSHQRGWQLGLAELQLGDAVDYLLDHGLLPAPFDQYLGNIQPGGVAQDIRVSVLPGELEQLDVRAEIRDVHGLSYRGIPGIQGLNGSLHLQPRRGKIRFNDEDVVVDLKGVYDQPWDMDDLSGVFSWQIEPDASKVWLSDIKARWNHLHLRSELSLFLPSRASGKPQTLSLLLGLPDASIHDRSRLLPDLLEPELSNWLGTALLAGDLKNGSLVLNGELEADRPANSLTTQLYVDVDHGELEYLQDWPIIYNLKGRVLVNAPSVDAWVERGRTLGGNLQPNSTRIRIRNQTGQPTQLKVAGKLAGDSSEAIRYFTDTPLQQMLNHTFDEWQAQGPLTASLQLDMPLGSEDAAPDVHLEAELENNRIALNDLNLTLTRVTGPFEYDSNSGIQSPEFTASVMGGDVYARLESTMTGADGAFKANLHGRGDASVAAFKQWMPMFLLDPLSGTLNYEADLNINTGSGDVVFRLDSNLAGTQIDYPAPLGKAADDADHSLNVEVRPGRETRISLNYDNRIRGVFALDDDGVDRGQVYLGGSKPFLPSDSGIEVRGQIDKPVVAEDWWAMWQRLLPLAEAESSQSAPATSPDTSDSSATNPDQGSAEARQAAHSENPLRLVDLQFNNIDAWTLPTGNAHLVATQQWGEWNVSIDSKLGKGTVVMPADDSPVQIAMDYIHIPQSEQDVDVSSSAQANKDAGKPKQVVPLAQVLADDTLKDLLPSDLLPMDIDLKEIMLGGWNFGSWNLSSRPIDQGAAITVNDSNLKGLHITGDARWLVDANGHLTSLDLMQINGSDIGKIQRAFRQDPMIEGKRLKSTASLSWRGSPMAFNPQSLNGLVSVRIEDGSWKTEGAGALKAFGALNVNSISRRLQLDFSDLYQSGIAFDVTKAKAKVENGMMTFTEPLVVDGPGAKVLASGSSNLSTETLDMKLAVTFPVTGSLPLVAVLAGFAAPVAGAIYVTEKLIGDELERFTSASYDVTGTWGKPNMKIREAFDNEVEGKRVRSFKDRFLSIFGLEESK